METFVDVTEVAKECGLQVKYYGSTRGRYFPVFGTVSGGLRFAVHNNSINNGRRALVERVFRTLVDGQYVPPPPCSANVDSRLRRFKFALLSRLGVHRPIPVEEFLQYYRGRRQTLYRNAAESLKHRPLTARDFAVRNAFVKAEKVNLSAKTDPAPRVIQPRDPRYNVEVGIYLRALEHSVYDGIAGVFGSPTVMKGYNATQVAETVVSHWETFSSPVAVGLDASRFDQHVRRQMLEWEHSVYLACYGKSDRKRLKWLLSGQLLNRGHMRCTDGNIKYAVDGSRMSGDMNTALGNCLIMCALVYTLAAERGVGVKLINNGDDCVVFMESRDLARFTDGLREWFLEFGFNMKVEDPVYVMEQIEFCQTKPVFDGEKWTMCRSPHVAMSKDAVCTKRVYASGRQALAYLRTVGECGLAMSGGLPVMQEYYRVFQRSGAGALRYTDDFRDQGLWWQSQGMSRRVEEPSDAARVSFWKAFGVSPTHQRALEAKLRGLHILVPDRPIVSSLYPQGRVVV